jgi:hypothetical protein
MYNIKIATYNFRCPACDTQIRKGDAYIEDDAGIKYCFCQLPERKLKPLKQQNHGCQIAVKSH